MGAAAERRVHGVLPAAPAVGGPLREQPVGAAGRPAVLLPDRDEVVPVARVRGEVRLDLGVQVVGTALRRAVAAGGERRGPARAYRSADRRLRRYHRHQQARRRPSQDG